jgi:hypothetical protein
MNRTSKSPRPAQQEASQAWTATEESLVRDDRAGLTPAQIVERKLVSLLNNLPLPLSRLQAARVQRPRP